MAVKFLKPAQVGTLYNKGEIAGFDAEIERQLIEAKVAIEVKSKAAKEAGAADPAAQQ